MPKTTWTNADLVSYDGPDTIYGPWTTIGTTPRSSNAINALIHEDNPWDRYGELASNELSAIQNDRLAYEAQKRAQAASRIGPVIGQALNNLDMAALPIGLIPNPLQPIADSYLSIRGLMGAAEDPSLFNLGMGALGAIPLTRWLRRGANAAKDALVGQRAATAERWTNRTGAPSGRGPAPLIGTQRGLRGVAEKQLADYKAQQLARIENRPSMQSLAEPPVTRVPMGATGDEYAAIRNSGGAFHQPPLTPEELLAEDEFWSQIARQR